MKVIAIDPGNLTSAVVVWDGERIINKLLAPNYDIIYQLKMWQNTAPCVIEKIASYGMAVGETTFETVFWSGRFCEAYGAGNVHRITRGQVKMHLCHSMKAKDGNIRQALIDRLGAPGTKKAPGVTYGISKDLWAALAVAVTWHDQNSGSVAA